MFGRRARGLNALIAALLAAGVFGLATAWPGRALTPAPCPSGSAACIALPIVRVPEPTPTPSPTATPACLPIPGASYSLIPIVGDPTDHPAAEHPDLNLALRGYRVAPGSPTKGFVFYGGSTDGAAPRLTDLFADHRAPAFSNVYQVNQWDGQYPGSFWPITSPPVTMAGLAATPGETLHVPGTFEPTDIYRGVYQVLVLYATEERLTLKYTREDNVVHGYTIHLEGICVEPALLAHYNQANGAGRDELPGLRAGQALGRARTGEVKLVIRDVGSFMDPRSHKDWWRNVPTTGDGGELWPTDAPWFQAHQRAIAERRSEVR